METRKRISIFGLGYVGCVCAGGLTHLGHAVTGVDVVEDKVRQVSDGLSTVIEPGLGELLKEANSVGLLTATTVCRDAVLSTELGFVCVGTPSTDNGHLELDGLFSVIKEIGAALRTKKEFFTVVIRSTVPPGTNERVRNLLQEVSGKIHGTDFGVVSNPEFLREGSAINDFLHPELTVVASECERSLKVVTEVYEGVSAKVRAVPVSVAELIKYVNNSFHALKVAFANEVGAVCSRIGIDAHSVMELFCEDRVLNISRAYLMPGTAYGGSCLPKDLKGLLTVAHDCYLDLPVLGNVERSNTAYKDLILQTILQTDKQRIGFVGLSFKAHTDDLRSSPTVDLIQRLIGQGVWVLIYDSNVHSAKLVGANRAEIDRRIPKIQSYMTDSISDLVERTDVVVITQKEDGIADEIRRHPDKTFIDLVRIDPSLRTECNYVGIAW